MSNHRHTRVFRLSAAVLLVMCRVHAQTPVISVDFATANQQSSGSGLLIASSASHPQTSMVAPIGPALWRFTNPNDVSRLQSSGASLQIVMSDRFCYPSLGWCGNQPPYENWETYEETTRNLALQVGPNVMYDVWNEPDNPQFWDGTEAQFFEAYLRAFRVIRQTLGPNAMIGGPSIAQSYNKTFITDFLNYCVAQGCEVNFLSWHELDDTDNGIASIAGNIADARDTILNNPQYASLKMSKIYVNESIGPLYSRRPGGILGYLYQLEQGGSDGAVRACWPDSAGVNECYNDTLDGLLTADTFQPRSDWWTYQFYAAGVAGRVPATTSDFRVVPLASKNSTGAQVLIGYFNQSAIWYGTPAPTPVQVQITGIDSLPFFGSSNAVHIVIDCIPDSGEQKLDGPVAVTDFVAPTNGQLNVLIPSMNAGDAMRVTLLPVSTTNGTSD